MRRTAYHREPNVRPVQKIELSEKNLKRRIIFVALFLVLGIGAIGYGLHGLQSKPQDWVEIEADSGIDTNCSDDFKFYYKLGQADKSSEEEFKQVNVLYDNLCVEAYQCFENGEDIAGVRSVYFINQHPNTEIQVNACLYKAFEKLEASGCRNLYLGPVYESYDDIFTCQDDVQTVDFDPYQNQELAELYSELAVYAGDASQVNVELLGDNKLMLKVSDEYSNFIKENGITSYIDFSWMTNAFIADFIAESMVENGFEHGIITSVDGYSRGFNVGDETSEMSFNIKQDNRILPGVAVTLSGQTNSVSFRNYATSDRDTYRYYTFSDGRVASLFVDISDGKYKTAMDQLTLFSKEKGCADIVLSAVPVYISDDFNQDSIKELKDNGIFSLYCIDKVIYHNSSDFEFSNVYSDEKDTFSLEGVE